MGTVSVFKSKKTQKKLADDSKLLRAWKRWHRDQLDAVLAGPHAVIATQVMTFLEKMEMTPASANALLALMRGHCWQNVDANTRFVLLHEINTAITKLREKHGMPPIDDPLPGKVNAFLALCELLHK
jgi:hypothetical protein